MLFHENRNRMFRKLTFFISQPVNDKRRDPSQGRAAVAALNDYFLFKRVIRLDVS